jgi:hypothetical protein
VIHRRDRAVADDQVADVEKGCAHTFSQW